MIQKQLVDKLALRLLEGEFTEGDAVKVDAKKGELTFEQGTHRPRPEPAEQEKAGAAA